MVDVFRPLGGYQPPSQQVQIGQAHQHVHLDGVLHQAQQDMLGNATKISNARSR